ncbi:MAG TPA: GNAT family N-acetyltransferase [Conexibacter sp.]|jgi:GNAT superfamily N-acetyltransferase
MLETLLQTLRQFYRAEAASAPDAEVIEHGAVMSVLTPSAPTQSLLNCVMCDDHEALAASLPTLSAQYGEAGVTHWMVWTRPGDAVGCELMKEAGHLLEYEPMAMALTLDALVPPAAGGPPFELDRNAHPVEITTLNERANGELPGAFGTAFAGLREPGFYRYVARLDGRPASCLVTFDHGDNCMIQWVATDPAHQRQRLGGRLLQLALNDAKARGMRTSTLESSYEGQRLYESLGYAALGRLGMWLNGDSPPELA